MASYAAPYQLLAVVAVQQHFFFYQFAAAPPVEPGFVQDLENPGGPGVPATEDISQNPTQEQRSLADFLRTTLRRAYGENLKERVMYSVVPALCGAFVGVAVGDITRGNNDDNVITLIQDALNGAWVGAAIGSVAYRAPTALAYGVPRGVKVIKVCYRHLEAATRRAGPSDRND